MTLKDLCNQLILEGVCKGKSPINKQHPDLCVNMHKCYLLDEALYKRWGKMRK